MKLADYDEYEELFKDIEEMFKEDLNVLDKGPEHTSLKRLIKLVQKAKPIAKKLDKQLNYFG